MYPAPNSDSFITMSLVVTKEMHISRLSNLQLGLFFPSKALKLLSRDTRSSIFCSESFLAYIYCLSHGLLAKLSTPLHQIHTGAFIKNGLIKKLSGLFFTNTNHQDSLVFVYGPSQNKYTLAYREFISNNRISGRLLQLISFTLAFALVMPRFEPAAEQRFDVCKSLGKSYATKRRCTSQHRCGNRSTKKQKVTSPRYV